MAGRRSVGRWWGGRHDCVAKGGCVEGPLGWASGACTVCGPDMAVRRPVLHETSTVGWVQVDIRCILVEIGWVYPQFTVESGDMVCVAHAYTWWTPTVAR